MGVGRNANAIGQYSNALQRVDCEMTFTPETVRKLLVEVVVRRGHDGIETVLEGNAKAIVKCECRPHMGPTIDAAKTPAPAG